MTFEKDRVRIFYKKLLAFYPRAFREQFGESMEQTFNDLCNERRKQAKQLSADFVLWTFIETALSIVKENLAEIKRGGTMENILSKNKSSAVIGFLLAMPLAVLLLIEMYNIEPLSSYFKALTTESGDEPRLNAFGKIFTLGTLLLLPVGFLISLVPVVRNARAGYGFTASPLNLLIAAALFIFIATLVTGLVVDQYPCWIGVPNCD